MEERWQRELLLDAEWWGQLSYVALLSIRAGLDVYRQRTMELIQSGQNIGTIDITKIA